MATDRVRLCLLLLVIVGAAVAIASAVLFFRVGALTRATQIGDYARDCLALVTVFGAAFALASTAMFAPRLRQSHPHLWQPYRHLFWSWPSQERSTALRTEVYSKISDKCTWALLTVQKLGYAISVIFALVAGLLLVLSAAHL